MKAIGNPSSTRVFEEYTAEVYGWAYRLLGRHHDALDVVQDVFLRWADQCGRRTPDHPRGWLRRVTVNRAIDLKRKDAHAVSPESTSPGAIRNRDAGAEIGIDHQTLRGDISIALGRLSDVQRSVLVAKVYDEMTFAQIARELDLSPSTIKTHFLRGVRVVRDSLQPRWDKGES